MGRFLIAAMAIVVGAAVMPESLGSLPVREHARAIAPFSTPAHAAEVARLNSDGTLQLADHRLACEKVRTRLDSKLENIGAAAPYERLLLLNPALLSREPLTVQLFVFHHECGHHRVGKGEIEADCWAIQRGVEGGWLDRKGLDQVCRSFGNAPETRTHPAAKRRCTALEQCFAAAIAAKTRNVAAPVKPAQSPTAAAVASPAIPAAEASTSSARKKPATPATSSFAQRGDPEPMAGPYLLGGPRLIREGTRK